MSLTFQALCYVYDSKDAFELLNCFLIRHVLHDTIAMPTPVHARTLYPH